MWVSVNESFYINYLNDSPTRRATTAALVISYDSFQMIPPNKVVETNLQLLRQPTEHRVHLGDCLEFGNIRQQIENSSNDLADREKSREYSTTYPW